MVTMVKQAVSVSVNVMEKSVTYMANIVFQMLFRIIRERGLPPDYVTGNRDCIERGLFTWLSEQSLQQLYVETYLPGSEEALERWDVEFSYTAEPDEKVERPNQEKLAELCGRLRRLPSDATYRVVVRTADFASEVEGWHKTELRPLNVEREESVSGWGYGYIGATLCYRGDTWDSDETMNSNPRA